MKQRLLLVINMCTDRLSCQTIFRGGFRVIMHFH